MSPWLSDLFLRSQSDDRLVALAREGQERAFTAIVERYRRALLAHARRMDPGREEDLVQQTFLCALTALQAGTEVRHLRGWLYEILRNLIARRPGTAFAQLDEGESLTESAQQVAERRMLAIDALGALAQLPPRQHNALLQVAIHGRPGSEVADAMGMSEGAVRQLVHRARATVRAAVTAITPFPLLRWLSNHRSNGAAGLTDLTLASGTASTAGVAVKFGVGALMATGVLAGGVISAVSLHHGPRGGHSQTLTGTIAADRGHAGGRTQGGALASTSLTGPGIGSGRRQAGSHTGGGEQRLSRRAGIRAGSGSDSRGPDGGQAVGSSGPGPGRPGGGESGSGSDGGGGGSGSDGGGRSGGSDGRGRTDGSGSDGGGGSQPGTVPTSGDGGSGGSDGGSSGPGGTSGGSDGGTSSGSDGGTGSGTGGGSSPGGGTVDGGTSGSGSGDGTSISGSGGGSGSTDGGQTTVSGGDGR